jgi:hypothetical protein
MAVARLVGTGIGAGVAAGAAAALVSGGESFPWAAAFLFLAAPTIALAFAMPDPRLGRYLGNSFAVVAVTSIWLGLNHISVDEDVTREIAFLEGFMMAFVVVGGGLLMGSLALLWRERRILRSR